MSAGAEFVPVLAASCADRVQAVNASAEYSVSMLFLPVCIFISVLLGVCDLSGRFDGKNEGDETHLEADAPGVVSCS